MPNALQQAGALSEPTNFAPLHTNRIFTGLWTNRSLLRDAATTDYQEQYGMGRQDSILGGVNSEITPRLTLGRRAGSSVYNGNALPPVKRFYSFNTFTLTDEAIRMMADTTAAVLDVTGGGNTNIFTKSPGAGSTYFLGVGNTLYMTNGVDNMQLNNATGAVTKMGVDGPTDAPTVSQSPRPNPYPQWQPGVAFSTNGAYGLSIVDETPNIQRCVQYGTTGAAEPNPWETRKYYNTVDNTVHWQNNGQTAWQANFAYANGDSIVGNVLTPQGNIACVFWCTQGGANSGATQPIWPSGIGTLVFDNGLTWTNGGIIGNWSAIGPNVQVLPGYMIVDYNGYLQQLIQSGVTGAAPPTNWATLPGAFTTDGNAIWQNAGPFSVAATAPSQYGFAYEDSSTVDISNMSPKSVQISVALGGQVTIQGYGTGAPGIDTIVLYRTAQGGSTFLELATFPNPGAGVLWTYIDNTPDSGLNTEWQAQVNGEGTPLPAGATCLGYHLGRVFAAVGNVVWVSSGPDATVGGSSGNAGFDTQLVVQSKIIRFWACSLGMVVFTVRDAYIILGSATDTDPLYVVVFIENLPLRNYDCFTVNKTTPYLLMGNNQLVALDPSAGIIEVGFPIADRLMDEYDAAASYVTFHSQSSLDSALYVANGAGQWYRMAQNNAPEQGSAWSTKAILSGMTSGCVQSVEVTPGVYNLLISGTTAGPIWKRDRTKNTDNGNKFAVNTVLGNIVLALPGQLAALSFITLESVKTGTRAGLALLLGEIFGTFETLNRTRQDPTNLPPSDSLFSDRYHFAQRQKTAWCRHFQMQISWPAEDAANELLTFTIFGQTWQEMRSQ